MFPRAFPLCFIYLTLTSDLYLHLLLTMKICDIDYLSLAMAVDGIRLACLPIPQVGLPYTEL